MIDLGVTYMTMTIDYQMLTVDELCGFLYHEVVVTGCSVLFNFDTRKKVSLKERALEKWYALSIASCEEVFVGLIVTEKGEELESFVIDTRYQMEKLVEDYCRRHCEKYKGKVCVDVGDWEDKRNWGLRE